MQYTKDGKVNVLYARLIEWLEDMGVPTKQREQYARDIIQDVEGNLA